MEKICKDVGQKYLKSGQQKRCISDTSLQNKAFTLVELIVTITILAILGTIGFISFQNYLVYSRDVVRITDINNMKSVLEYTYTESGRYPLPDDGTEVTYSGGTVWTQGTFGKKTRRKTKRLNKFPTDPLTEIQYTYSVLNTQTEYELGAVFEGDEVAIKGQTQGTSPAFHPKITQKTYANNSDFKAYISGNYNGQIAKTNTGGIDYILALPSIISSDLSNPKLDGINGIISKKLLSFNGYKNIPHSYGISYTPENEDDVKFVNPDKYVVFSGSLDSLKTEESTRTTFLENLQKAYSGTLAEDKGNIANLKDLAISSNQGKNHVSTLINNFLGAKIDLIPEAVITAPTTTGGAVSFDGTNDYLSRTTDLTGNTDSKTFTFSAWVYVSSDLKDYQYITNSSSYLATQIRKSDNQLFFNWATETGNGLRFHTTLNDKLDTWVNIILSGDMSDVNRRHLFINDIEVFPTYLFYPDSPIKFLSNNLTIGDHHAVHGTYNTKGNLSNIFLDYNYRDLSQESERRKFITADGKPTASSVLAAENPILYLPLASAETAGTNLGTGGDFDIHGTLATADTSPYNWNVVASEFDGTDDYLSSNNIGATDGKKFIISYIAKKKDSFNYPFTLEDNSNHAKILTYFDGTTVRVWGYDDDYNDLFRLEADYNTTDKNINVQISLDNDDVTKSKMIINGENQILKKNIVSGKVIDIYDNTAQISYYKRNDNFFNSIIGELYFDTKYIDLSANNPFWDSVNNKPKPVRQVIAETGVTPLIAMPIRADNPGKNYGSGGDFTLHGGGLKGAEVNF